MSSNLFDTYTPTEYIPRPFDAYMKAGEAQQGQYNQLRDAIQNQQDQFSNMKVRLADEEQKNQFLNNIQQQAYDLYDKNKHYSPDMYNEVRSFMRKATRDPRINAWSTALKNEQDFKEIEKRLKAAGQEPLYSHKHAVETPVYDNRGNMIYNPETTDLGIEAKLDWVNAGKKLVNEKILPRLVQSGMNIQYIKQKGGDGKMYERPVIVDTSGKVLDKNEPRVQKALKELLPIWEQESTEGRQWKKFNPEGNSFDFLSRLVAEQRDVQSSFKDVAGSQFNKFMASFNNEETTTDLVDKYNAARLGLNAAKSDLKLVPFVKGNPEEYVPNSEELKVIKRDAAKEYTEYYNAYNNAKNKKSLSSNDAAILRKNTGMSPADLIENMSKLPYLNLDHFVKQKTMARAGVKTQSDLAESYNKQGWDFDKDIKEEFQQQLGAIPASTTIINGGEGKLFNLQSLLQMEDGEAPLANIVKDLKVVGGENIADPSHNNFRKPYVTVQGLVNAETFKNLNFEAKKQIMSLSTTSPEDAKKTGGYIIEMAVPSEKFSSENAAQNVGQKLKGIKEGYNPEYYRNSTKRSDQLHNNAMNRWDKIVVNNPQGLQIEEGVIMKANQNTGNYDVYQNGKLISSFSPYDYENLINQ